MKKFLKWFCFILLAFLTIVGAGSYAVYQDINRNVKSENIDNYFTEERPQRNSVSETPLSSGTANYVIIGSDSRAGDNSEYGDEQGQRADTTMIVHLNETRNHVDVVSIPRDSIVNIPSCKLSDGSLTEPLPETQFNTAFSLGDTTSSSIACTISTIENNTNIFIDGYAIVDFNGFKNIIDAMGGVEMNIPQDMVSTKAGLNLSAGTQTLNGEDALAYARTRSLEVGGGTGSDLERINRQQELVQAIIQQSLSSSTLTNPEKVYNLANSTLESVVFSEDITNVKDLASLMYSLKDMKSENVDFYTVPNTPWVYDTNRVIWTEEASLIWEAINNDTPISETGLNPNM